MRIFWSIIGLLVIATLAVFFIPSGGGSAPANTGRPAAPQQQERSPEQARPGRASESIDRATERRADIAERPTEPGAASSTEAEAEVESEAEAETGAETGRPDVDTSDETPTRRPEALADNADAPDLGTLDEALGIAGSEAPQGETVASAPARGEPIELFQSVDVTALDVDEAVRGEYTYEQNAFVGPPSGRSMADVDGGSELGSVAALREARARHESEKSGSSGSSGGARVEGEWSTVEVAEGVALKKRASDGAYLVGDRFVVTGAGTKEKPYELTWDMLYSVRETYRPRKGKEEIPEWTSWIDGSWVRITGFMATAIFAEDVDELLIMKNEWDGCCIGVPPTPYDAIEVTLDEKIKLSAGTMTYGTISGKLVVEPYKVRNWLVGLYMLENGTVESSGF